MDPRDLSVSAALGALSVTVALAFGLVLRGDRWILPLVVIALLPHVVGAIARSARHTIRWSTWLVGIGVSAVLLVVAVVAVGGIDPGHLLDAFANGIEAFFDRPSPVAATDGVLIVAMCAVWAVATVADYLTFERGSSVAALMPGVVVMVVFGAASAPDAWIPIAAFGVVSVVFLALQHRRLLDHQRTWIGDPPTMRDSLGTLFVGLLVGVLAVAASVGVAVALVDADRPLVDLGEIFERPDSPSSYRTNVAPLLNVGDELRQPEIATVLRVRADAPAYWRTLALDQYSSLAGGQWTLDASDDEVEDSLDDAVPADALVQQYEITPALSERWIPAAYQAVEVEGADLGLVVPSSSTLVTDADTIGGTRYTVRSALPPDASGINRAAAAAAVPDDVVEYTELPDDVPPIIAETAQAVAGDLPDPVAKAGALRDFFRDPSFVYDPDVSLGDDIAAIDTFMRERRGFCVQFATAYALMARSLGIPARIGIGYVPGTLDEASGTYVVTNQDAHAWPELYFTGTGWATPFDPTPPASPALPGGSDLPGEIEEQTTPTTTPVTAAPPPTTPQTSPTPTAGPSGSQPNDTPTGDDGGSVEIETQEPAQDPQPLFSLAALLGVLVVLLIVPFVVLFVLKHRRRRRRRNESDPAVAITGAWREALDTLIDHRVPASEAETPLETAARASTSTSAAAWEPMSSLATSYGEVRYAEHAPTQAGADAAWRDVDALRDVLDEPLGPFAKVRARLSLRSLRQDRGRASDHDRTRVSETV